MSELEKYIYAKFQLKQSTKNLFRKKKLIQKEQNTTNKVKRQFLFKHFSTYSSSFIIFVESKACFKSIKSISKYILCSYAFFYYLHGLQLQLIFPV